MTRPRETWEAALDAGEQHTAVLRFLLETGGGDLHYWFGWAHEPEALPGLLADTALTFSREHGLHVAWAAPDGLPVRKAAAYLISPLFEHLAHWQFGRPRKTPFHEWSDAMKTQHFVGLDTARIALIRREAILEAASAFGAAELKARVARDTHTAKWLKSQGLPNGEIARQLGSGVSERTVRRYLASP